MMLLLQTHENTTQILGDSDVDDGDDVDHEPMGEGREMKKPPGMSQLLPPGKYEALITSKSQGTATIVLGLCRASVVDSQLKRPSIANDWEVC